MWFGDVETTRRLTRECNDYATKMRPYNHELRMHAEKAMQLIADEARSYGEGLGGVDVGHWQVILDHVKDVVITVGAEGAVKIFNPTGERVFGYSRAKAEKLMLDVHHKGKAVVASGSREAMERNVEVLHGYGLWATVRQDT